MAASILEGDVLAWAASYDGPPFHALLCDPPYHLTEITKRYGSPDAKPPGAGEDGSFRRLARGFMGKTWDGGDVAFRPETWAALARHLYPGAFGMAFAGSRGWHRMAVAIEDAGLIIHPTIFGWAYGSGFPKATRIDTQVDRRAGATRPVVGRKKHAPKFDAAGHGYREKDNGYNSKDREAFDLTAPATDMARAWAGHRYGLQALKPALEPIVVFQRPYDGPPVDCITETGAGALWVDGGRVEGVPPSVPQPAFNSPTGHMYGMKTGEGRNGAMSQDSMGRWPANLALLHLPDCGPAGCVMGCAVAALGAWSGPAGGRGPVRGTEPSPPTSGIYGDGYRRASWTPDPGDEGTAARFFFQADYALDRLEAADAVAYVAKATAAEREAGLDPVQVALVRELYGDDLPDFDLTTVGDGRETPIDNAYQRGETTRRNTHPTLKPITLTRWLASLLLPPPDYGPRRLLVPFAGTGSELIGATLAGWEEPTGVELDAQHVAIARARLRYWGQQRHKFDQGQPIKIRAPKRPKAGASRTLWDLEEDAA